jgi:hypothetical protein
MRGANVKVGIKTWGELIEENRARLQFFQETLQHTADESAANRHLQEKHSRFLEGVIVEDDESVSTADEPGAVERWAPVTDIEEGTAAARLE